MLGVCDAENHHDTYAFSPFARSIVYGSGYGEHGTVVVPKGFVASRSLIKVLVDMGTLTVAFEVNGSPRVVAPRKIPAAVRPWVQVWYKGESVSIVGHPIRRQRMPPPMHACLVQCL